MVDAGSTQAIATMTSALQPTLDHQTTPAPPEGAQEEEQEHRMDALMSKAIVEVLVSDSAIENSLAIRYADESDGPREARGAHVLEITNV